jgi:hypothetical protein
MYLERIKVKCHQKLILSWEILRKAQSRLVLVALRLAILGEGEALSQ